PLMKHGRKKTQSVRGPGEFGLIREIKRVVGKPSGSVIEGVGDDCAVLRFDDAKKYLLYTCDPVVEGIHYRPGDPARKIGWKAMARNLSDIAAMGGQPLWAVVSIGLRRNTPVSWVKNLYTGLNSAAREFGCQIVGGDTTHVSHEQFVVVALVGEVE